MTRPGSHTCGSRPVGRPGWTVPLAAWLAACACLAFLPATARAQDTAGASIKHTLIVYDADFVADDNAPLVTAVQLQQLLGHFSLTSTLQPLNKYHLGTMGAFDYCFFLGVDRKIDMPTDFTDDLRAYQGRFFWIDYGIRQVPADFLAARGLQFVQEALTTDYDDVVYKGFTLSKYDHQVCAMKVTDPRLCRVIATTRSTNSSLPYITSSGNFWYVADNPFSYVGDSDRYLAFSDVLHDFLGMDHKPQRRAIIRIEDVNPTYGAAPLRHLADQLQALHVPFVVSLIPRYENPATHEAITVSADQSFGRAVQYMAAHGGSIAMHGYNHRYTGITADDFEFWDRDQGKPIAHDEFIYKDYVDSHVTKGVDACVDAGLYPVAWETPHYAASDNDYTEIGKFFSTAVEQRLAMNRPDFSQYFPFVIQRDIHNQKIIPENLGYIEMQHGDDAEANAQKETTEVDSILRFAANARVVRDASVGVFFHPFLDPGLCERLVRGLQGLGYSFIDLRAEQNTVQTNDIFIATGKASGTVHLDHQFLHEFYVGAEGQVAGDTVYPQPLTGVVSRTVDVPAGWIYVCRAQAQASRSLWHSLAARLAGFWAEHFQKPLAPPAQEPARAGIIWDETAKNGAWNDQASLEAAFGAMGMNPDRVTLPNFAPRALSNFNLLLVPNDAAKQLRADQVAYLVSRIQKGLHVVLDGYSPLSQALGVTPRPDVASVDTIRDSDNYQLLRWPQAEQVFPPLLPVNAAPAYAALDGTTVGATFQHGQGTCLFLATAFDPETGYGYSRYTTLPWVVGSRFPLRPGVIAKDVDLYFEPGDREGVDLARLVQQWKRWHVRAIHAATWHFFPNHTGFDYARLVQLCHENGIAVYAWFELPYVTRDFYDAHPEWREKTATGVDATADWRLPMAMEIPECRQAVNKFVTDLMRRYDWDGINLAEICYDCEHGPKIPDYFIPMHPYLRSQFKARYGWDPLELVNKQSPHYYAANAAAWKQFQDYRAGTLATIYEDLLTALQPFAAGSGQTDAKEVIVTAYDTLTLPEIRENTGADAMQVMGMMRDCKAPASLADNRRFTFTLDVEDSDQMWDEPPDRYHDMGARYAKWVTDPQRLMLNCNMVKFRMPNDRLFATDLPLGVETMEMVRSAREASSRVIVYSEASLPVEDARLLCVASGAAAESHGTRRRRDLEAPGTVFLSGQDYSDDNVRVDGGQSALDSDGEVVIPAGEHQVRLGRGVLSRVVKEVPRLHLLNATEPLLDVSQREDRLGVEYNALAPCLLSVDRKPVYVEVDDEPAHPESWHSGDTWTVSLPAGKHTAMIRAESPVRFEAEIFSALSSTGIVAFGAVAILLLLILLGLAHREKRRSSGRPGATG